MVSEALKCDNNGLEGCNYGIQVWLGEKPQVYDTKFLLWSKKHSKFGRNPAFLKIYRKIKFYSFTSWPNLIYNPCQFMAHFKSYIDHYYGPAGFGILRIMEKIFHTPTFFGLRINGFRAEIRFFQKIDQEAWYFKLFGLRGCDYGIWVWLGEKTQLYYQKWPLNDEKTQIWPKSGFFGDL